MVLLEYNTKIQKYWKSTGMDGTVWEDSWKKPRRKLNSNLENVIVRVITLEIAKGELIYGKDICKNTEGYTLGWPKFDLHFLIFSLTRKFCSFGSNNGPREGFNPAKNMQWSLNEFENWKISFFCEQIKIGTKFWGLAIKNRM